MKDYTDKLLDALDHSEQLTDAELDALLQNEEARDLYGIVNKTADALTETPEPDVEKEWEHFCALYGKRQPIIIRLISGRHAAAAAIAGVVSLVAVATTIGIRLAQNDRNTDSDSNITKEAVTINASLTIVAPDTVRIADERGDYTTVFKDERLDRILPVIGRYYGKEVRIKNPETGNLRLFFKWDEQLTIEEIVDQLNSFDQISIKYDDKTLNVE
ncbi:MAG: DUF4974 domain-containing protein [Muribaculaceae bacterium]|nr:DUF4974 domain-containing protein [Muribaculaceae bacterium]